MDDADGGRRGLRARPGRELSRALADHWGLEPAAEWIDLGGSSSLNLLVANAGRRFVARVHRPAVTPERLVAIHRVRAVLPAGGVPCATPLPTLRGAPWVDLGDRLLELEAYADHDAVMDSWERLETGMGLLARVHDLLRGVDTGRAGRRPPFANHLEPADVLAWTRRATTRIRGWRPSAEESDLAAGADRLAHLVAEAEAGLVPRLPRQLVHGDFWDDNVLFGNGRRVLLADFDFMGERARVDDLALTLHHASFDLGAGLEELPARLARLVRGYDRGLEVPLSDAERAALPLAMARQSLSSIAGWVARLDDEATARRHAARARPEVTASLRMLADLGRWRDAFA
jgi:Ser/Thr protein kinase RdoA (MazF antagonist)